MSTRPAAKAGSWYLKNEVDLKGELQGYLSQVPKTINDSALPVPGARVIIAPHAGYDYSGKCAAWAYSCLDLSKAKCVFVLGPSHTYYFEGCAVTTFAKYATPFGDFKVDRDIIQRVKEAGDMDDIPRTKDVSEHSLEMHLPYLHLRCQQTFSSPEEFPTIVPVLIGDNRLDKEKDVGRALLPYFKDPENAFVISSDFCHWGLRFNYMMHSPNGDISNLSQLRSATVPKGPPIHETIRLIDEAAMDAVKSGSHDAFFSNLDMTENTVCGRHPIGVALAALEYYAQESNEGDKGRFKIVQYDRSSLVKTSGDSSVSYVSAYAVL